MYRHFSSLLDLETDVGNFVSVTEKEEKKGTGARVTCTPSKINLGELCKFCEQLQVVQSRNSSSNPIGTRSRVSLVISGPSYICITSVIACFTVAVHEVHA